MPRLMDRMRAKAKADEAKATELAAMRAQMAAEWAARHGVRPLDELLCPYSGPGQACYPEPHVHPRRPTSGGLYPTFVVDPVTGAAVRRVADSTKDVA